MSSNPSTNPENCQEGEDFHTLLCLLLEVLHIQLVVVLEQQLERVGDLNMTTLLLTQQRSLHCQIAKNHREKMTLIPQFTASNLFACFGGNLQHALVGGGKSKSQKEWKKKNKKKTLRILLLLLDFAPCVVVSDVNENKRVKRHRQTTGRSCL